MYFVCRWRDHSPLSKQVVTVPDATVLDWFRRGWDQDDPEEWIERELAGGAYGLESIFEEARERNLPRPETVDELRVMLNQYLWVEGDDEGTFIRLGEHALRVRTDDDEVDLAYYFVDDEAVAASPDRLAFLVHDTWPLPADAAAPGTPFTHAVPVRTARPAASGPESTFSVRVSWEHRGIGTNLDLEGAVMFPGVTLPDLAAQLRGVEDPGAYNWPHEAWLLRALVAPDEDDIGPALRRYVRMDASFTEPVGLGHAPAHDATHENVLDLLLPTPPAESLVQVDTHIAQVARYINDFFGFDHWFLFDTRWAAAHRDLARSLLRYAAHWDPYEP